MSPTLPATVEADPGERPSPWPAPRSIPVAGTGSARRDAMELVPPLAPVCDPSFPGDELVVGTMDAAGVVEQVSVDARGLLGTPTDHLVGTSLLQAVHGSDHAAVVAGCSAAGHERFGVSVQVHVGRPGRWTLVNLLLTPMADSRARLGFAVSPAEAKDATARADRLEHHLLRIARELEAAGIGVRADDGIDLDLLPGVDELSPRQWDVLRRLLRGERVPGIARELFLSPSTVRNHLVAIFAKVGVHSQEELLRRLRPPAARSVAAR